MANSYYYKYLKDYILDVGNRIIGFDKKLLKDECALEEFLQARSDLAEEEFNRFKDLKGGGGHELAMQTLLEGLTELEPTEEEIEAELNFQKDIEEIPVIGEPFDLNFLRKEERVFHFGDMEMRYFQVKNGNTYQILVQDNSNKDAVTSLPYRYDAKRRPHSKPVCENHAWCLDRCKGIIDVWDKESIFVHSDDEIVEVAPTFRKFRAIGEDFPDGELRCRRFTRHVDVLLPLQHPSEVLEQMVGCDNIKNRLAEFRSLAEYNKACLRQSPQLPVMKIFLHSVFYGNPGTGKTTVCRLYGALLKEVGLLSKGHVIVADRSTFSGDSFGDEEEIVAKLLEMAKGGILMIDEAYLLQGVHKEDPSQMVLPLLLSALADENKKDFAVVLCGYKDKLDEVIKQNPGLYSRFVNRFEFKDYTLDELTEIAVRYLKTFGHYFSVDGLKSFQKELEIAMSNSNTDTWANARSVKNMIEHTYIRRAIRYSKDGKIGREITAEDVSSIPYEPKRRIGF